MDKTRSSDTRRDPQMLPHEEQAVETTAMPKEQPWVGRGIRRKEDARLLRGRGKFVDDFKLPGMLYLQLVRSPYGHARIISIDVSAAASYPGVICTLTGAEVAQQTTPYIEIGTGASAKILDYCMALDRVRYQGEPVVAVVARSRGAAEDAAELVNVEYEPLEPVMSAEEALADKSVIHPAAGTNQVWDGTFEYGHVDQAFQEAAHIIDIDRMHFHRFSSTPLECNAVIGHWDLKDNRVYFHTNNSFPTIGIQLIAPALGIHIDQIRVQTFDIGGSFGIKITNYPQMTICALASRKAGGKPVMWTEVRTEHMQASAHGNERTYLNTRVALDKDGVVTAIESLHLDDCGAYPRYEPLGCVIWAQVFPGVYRIRHARIRFQQAMTNKCPVGPNRGYSRMQQLWFMERCVDICGHELGIPADEMRLRNYIQPQEFPYETPNGCIYDSGNYPGMLELAKKLIGWDEWKNKQRDARREGRLLGIGIGTTLDSGTNNFGQSRIVNANAPFSGNTQAANAKLDLYGEIVVSVGSVPQGQGHETVAAQVVADVLGVTPDMVTVRPGFDTERNVHTGHSGTYASQFAVSGLSAVHGAAQKLKKEILKLASYALDAPVEDLEMCVGEQGPQVRVRSKPEKTINYWALSNIINMNNAGLPDDLQDVSLNCRYLWRAPFQIPDVEKKFGNLTLTYAAQLHIAVIEVDQETGQPKLLDYCAVDDCGKVINPAIVQGQVHGATAHGIGAALMENCAYDEFGNMLASTFSDYAPITSMNIPNIKYGYIETPSPMSYSGAKGMGEGGAAPVHAISAALHDALHPLRINITESFNNGDMIYHALQQARAGQPSGGVRIER
jgi:2-furoyl-CoA dehydrogenase large subunit